VSAMAASHECKNALRQLDRASKRERVGEERALFRDPQSASPRTTNVGKIAARHVPVPELVASEQNPLSILCGNRQMKRRIDLQTSKFLWGPTARWDRG